MTGLILGLVGLVAVLSLGGAVLFLRNRQTAEREAFQALAARRAWSLQISDKLGRPAVVRLTARSGAGWQAEARRAADPATGNPKLLSTEFAAEEPRWADGTLVIGPPSAARMIEGTAGALAVAALVGDIGPTDPATLRAYPATDGISVLASADPAHRIDIAELGQIVADWTPQIADETGFPVVIIGPEGLRVRLRHGTRRADRMEQFIDFALEIARAI